MKLWIGSDAPDATVEDFARWGRVPKEPIMEVAQKPSPNFGYPQGVHGRGGEKIVAIVDHIMGGALAACDAWFQNPASQVSAHYGIGKDGSIHQYVADADAAWGAGILNHPDTSLPWLSSSGGVVNRAVISIEHEGQPGDVFPPAQLAATIALHKALVARYGITVDRQHIVGHYRLDSVNRAHCPGDAFPWDALFAALGGDHMTTEQRARLATAMDEAWSVKTELEQAGQQAEASVVFDAIVAFKVKTGLQPA